NFTISSAYKMICGFHIMEAAPIWKTIWKLSVPERVRCFAWQIAHGRLPTNKMISRWANSAPYCFHCTDTEESILHVLRDCKLAAMVWTHLLPIEARHLFFVGAFKDWVSFNLITTGWKIEQFEWKNVWATTCYFLWQWRNKAVHDDTYQRPFHPASQIMQYVQEYHVCATSGVQTEASQRVAVQVRWMRPQQGYLSLNTDGAVKNGSQQAGCGGVIRNGSGNWVCGFAKALGPCSAFVAELWGILEGITIAKDRNIMRIEVQVDSKAVLQYLTSPKNGSIRGRRLVRKIRELIEQGIEVQFKHVYREANRVADWLANLGCNLANGSTLFEFPPREVQSLVDDD
ncbi:ribonuclease H protein, partial [Trifolium medium]|nr:ribonuclease H protein [Trifolium medium]